MSRFKNLLFLCTGNYYRSRFAEILFNAIAVKADLNWKAASRALEIGISNVGPMSPQALKGLENLGIVVKPPIRFPLPLQEQELAQADLIIALDEEEHRSYIEMKFPNWAKQVKYWHIHDLGITPAEEALSSIEREVRLLIQHLSP